MLTHPNLEQFIHEVDRAILKHLKSVFVEQSFIKPSKVNVRIGFHENEFFTNSMLEYEIRFEEGGEEQIEAIVGTQIDWKDVRKNVTKKRVRKT